VITEVGSVMTEIAYVGLDESGSLTGDTPWFTVAAVIASQPAAIRHLIRRAALRSGKRSHRAAKVASELKWSNSSRRIRTWVLADMAQADVEIFALTVRKERRRIEDTPEHYAILVCELLSMCWNTHLNVALSLDRHFTSSLQIAAVNTSIYHQWPRQGLLSITHVDSQRSPLVQLADFVAGSVYSSYKANDQMVGLIEPRLEAVVEDWPHIKARWMHRWQ